MKDLFQTIGEGLFYRYFCHRRLFSPSITISPFLHLKTTITLDYRLPFSSFSLPNSHFRKLHIRSTIKLNLTERNNQIENDSIHTFRFNSGNGL